MGSSRRSQPLPPGWAKLRAKVLRQEGYACALCGDEATEVDHVIPASAGGTDHRSNLQAICVPCHKTKTARESHATRPSRRRDPEPHPGVVRSPDDNRKG